jgi:hypothetical protein
MNISHKPPIGAPLTGRKRTRVTAVGNSRRTSPKALATN